MPITSEVDICSSALNLLGAKNINSLTDQNDQNAILCNRLYGQTRDAMLQEHAWNFAIKRVQLVATTGTPIGYAREFQLPVDYLQMLNVIFRGVTTHVHRTEDIPYVIEGDKLLTDEGEISIRYVFQQKDVQSYSPLFVSAITYRLAQKLAIPVTADPGKATQMKVLEDELMAKSRNLDTRTDSSPRYLSDDLIRSRFGHQIPIHGTSD